MKPKDQTQSPIPPAHSTLRRPLWIVLPMAGVAAVIAFAVIRSSVLPPDKKTEASLPMSAPNHSVTFSPSIPNATPVLASSPSGMAWIPGGEFSMGAMDPPATTQAGMHSAADARPIHRVYVDGFWMDKNDVTNEEFARFVKATGYATLAERTPNAEDFPSAPPENLVAGSVVFLPPDHPVQLNNHFQWWSYLKGANWRHPEGPKSNLKGREKYPVVQVAYPDASPMRHGLASDCRLKPSGNSRRAEVSQGSSTRGETNSDRAASGWRIPTRGTFLTLITETTGTWESLQSRNFRRTRTACMTWQEMCGSGPATGIVQTTTKNSQEV